MRRLVQALSMTVALVGVLFLAQGSYSTTAQGSGTPVARVDPEALFEALAETPMSDVDLPGFLEPKDGDVVGNGDLPPVTGTVGINWPDDGMFINHFVFDGVAPAADSYAGVERAARAAMSPLPEFEYDDGVEGFCRPSEKTDEVDATETCYTLRGNIIVVGFGSADLSYGRSLAYAGALHLEIVAAGLEDDPTVVGTPQPWGASPAMALPLKVTCGMTCSP